MPTTTAPTTGVTLKTGKARDYTATGRVGQHMSRAQALKTEIDRLTAELSQERTWLLAHMESNALDQLNCGDFQVQRRLRHNWKYSPALEREMLRIKESQKWEISQGEALDRPTVSAAFVIREARK